MFERVLPGTPPATTVASTASPSTATATPPTTTTTSTTTTTTPTTPTLVGAGASLVHVHLASLQLLAVQVVDRGLGLGLGGHLHECESPGLAAELVRDDIHGRNLTEGLEGFSQILFGDVARQISYVDVHSRSLLFVRVQTGRQPPSAPARGRILAALVTLTVKQTWPARAATMQLSGLRD
jgi:hypothetical protein